ncbi:restriction endonuclease subunit S [Pseudomonas viridiflava]
MSSKQETSDVMENNKPTLLPKLRFPEFRKTDGWEPSVLAAACDMQAGKFVSASNIAEHNRDGLFPCYGGNGLRGYTETHTHNGTYPLIGRQGALCGNVRLVSGQFHATEHAIVATPKKAIDVGWLYYSLDLLNLNQFATGQAQPGLSVDVLKNVSLAMPPLETERKKISDCLSPLDELITAQGRKVNALKTHKKWLMQELFPRQGEAQPRLRLPEFQSAGDWDPQPFGEFVAKSFYGTSSSTSPSGQYPVLRMGNMVDGGLDFKNLVYIDLTPESFESFRLEDGDILLNRTNSPALVGKISIFRLKTDCITASYIVTYRLKKKRIDPLFCNFMLNTPLQQGKIRALAKPSVSQANINPTTFKKELIVSTPELPEQQLIADCLNSLEELIAAHTQKLEALKTHKKGLMQQLFPTTEVVGA